MSTTPLPWRVYRMGPTPGPGAGERDSLSIISPAGDAELGNWMVAERVRREEDVALIIRAVNAHNDVVAALKVAREAIAISIGPCSALKMVNEAIAKAEAP